MTQEDAPNRTPVFSDDLGLGRGKLVFYSWPDAVSWVQREHEAWTWLTSMRITCDNGHTAQNVRNAISVISSALDSCASQVAHAHTQSQSFQQAILSFIKKGIPISVEPVFTTIKEHSNHDPVMAALAAGALLRDGFQRDQHCPVFPRAAAFAQLASMGISTTPPPSFDNFKAISAQLDGKLTSIAKTHEEHKEKGDAIYAEHSKALKQLHDQHTEQNKQTCKTTEDRLVALEKTYNDKMALQATVAYWRKKAGGHKAKSIAFAIASLVCGGGGFYLLDQMGRGLFLNHQQVAGSQQQNAQNGLNALGNISMGEVAIFIIAATGVVWLVRLLVRLLLSELHLKNTADERAVMIQAYLSMLRDPKHGLTADDRKVILGVLFRPSPSGLVKEDALPHPLLEMLTRTK